MRKIHNRLRTSSDIRESVVGYLFDNPNESLKTSAWLRMLARELADALQRENDRPRSELKAIEIIVFREIEATENSRVSNLIH